MLCACTCYSASADLSAIRDVLAKGRDIFVIDLCGLVATEAAWLLLELLIERCSLSRFILRLFQRSVITCSHCGAPFRVPFYL